MRRRELTGNVGLIVRYLHLPGAICIELDECQSGGHTALTTEENGPLLCLVRRKDFANSTITMLARSPLPNRCPRYRLESLHPGGLPAIRLDSDESYTFSSFRDQ